MSGDLVHIPYPPISGHGVTGDRRTAALIASDGTVDWMCLPDYGGRPVFGALLDAERGGYFRFGPEIPASGAQRYRDQTSEVVTRWTTDTGEIELGDVMPWPEDERPQGRSERRVLIRRLACTRGMAVAAMKIMPRHDFDAGAEARPAEGGAVFRLPGYTLGLWTSFRLSVGEASAEARIELCAGDEVWAVLTLDEAPLAWSIEAARCAAEGTAGYWRAWLSGLTYHGPRRERIGRSALVIHLLSHAPEGSMVAAPTTSLPERIGGDRNYDYRYAWVRDASLSVGSLAMLGGRAGVERYLDWLSGLPSSTPLPLQPCYRTSGDVHVPQRARKGLAGYRGSSPVRFGNRACKQVQLGGLGFMADCMLVHLENGGVWRERYWALLKRCADFVGRHWAEEDSGIWELERRAQYTSSKVMAWVLLDRTLKIAGLTGRRGETEGLREAMAQVHEDVLRQGWSEAQQSFVQRYGAETMDASALLIPIMGFLAPDDPRVQATIDRIERTLMIGDLVHRFDPLTMPGQERMPLGAFEGAFLPCTFWLVAAYAMARRTRDAERVLSAAEGLMREIGLLSEEVDARDLTLLGNYPLLFSHAEYVRAVVALEDASVRGSLPPGIAWQSPRPVAKLAP
jgi:GH15 family glucan-1,4-alpha-glucosidase